MTFAAPIKVTIQLIIYDSAGEGSERTVRDIKEQEVYFGEIPLMTENGTFIINGTERVVVSQLHRSPGVFFDHDKGKTHSSGKLLYQARVIPYRGSWLDFEFDPKDLIYVRIDRRRKLHATVLLQGARLHARGPAELLLLRHRDGVPREGRKYSKSIEFEILPGQRATRDIKVGDEVIVKQEPQVHRARSASSRTRSIERLPLDTSEVVGKVAAEKVIDEETGEVLVQTNEEVTEDKLEKLREGEDPELQGPLHRRPQRRQLPARHAARETRSRRRTRRSSRSTVASARAIRRRSRRRKHAVPEPVLQPRALRPQQGRPPQAELQVLQGRGSGASAARGERAHDEDILHTVKHLIELKNGRGSVDDIDHLGNRRVRAVGELMENQYRIGLVRMERAIKERMSMSQEIDTLMPHDLINAKPVSAVVKEYFGSSQLSQFMDQTNPLSEVTHKRRLSALGPGGLTRERAGFEVRDVHATHYGRICPIETPEGPNIGLIASLSTFARVNEYGFVETPYRKVVEGHGHDEVKWFSALEEEGHYIAQADGRDDKGNAPALRLRPRSLQRRVQDGPPEQITLMDVSRRTSWSRWPRAHPVPRARRRQPRPHGREHAAPGGAAAPLDGADRRHGPRAPCRARLGRVHPRQA
jgi:DNA-directed RNA polymerase subunit beta